MNVEWFYRRWIRFRICKWFHRLFNYRFHMREEALRFRFTSNKLLSSAARENLRRRHVFVRKETCEKTAKKKPLIVCTHVCPIWSNAKLSTRTKPLTTTTYTPVTTSYQSCHPSFLDFNNYLIFPAMASGPMQPRSPSFLSWISDFQA